MSDQPFEELLAWIVQGEAVPCDAGRLVVAGCLAECLKRGDDQTATAQRWKGRLEPGPYARELATGILAGTVRPNGFYFCMSKQDVTANPSWPRADFIIICGEYENHLFAQSPWRKGTTG
jgi:hypothetical protein